MDFIYFEAIVDDDVYDDENEADFCVEKNEIDFVDDSDMSDNVCNYYRFENVIRSVENALEDPIIESSTDLENSNDVSNFCNNSDEEVVEIDDFERSNEKVNKFEESLLIPHG